MDNATTPPDATRLAYSVDDFAELVGIGRTKIYQEIRDGRLRAKKLGSRTLNSRQGRRRLHRQPPRHEGRRLNTKRRRQAHGAAVPNDLPKSPAKEKSSTWTSYRH